MILVPALLLWAAAASAVEPAPAPTDFPKRFRDMHFGGSLSINWRNVGPRKPGFETQIQNEVYLADIYYGLDGPLIDGVPFVLEFNMPTASQGDIRLFQLNVGYDRVDDWRFRVGKFLVPFGRYNELYRPDQFLTVTRPLLYASPDSLDLVVRINSPRPPLSLGYTDIGARISYYPPVHLPYVPNELTFFVVNGLGENNNRQRTFPNADNLGIPSVPDSGSNVDFGHQNNNLADNNNAKSLGARAVFGLGDLHLPWPIPESLTDLNGVSVGLSGMGGQYDLEGALNYQMYGLDFSFDYLGFDISGEYLYSFNQFLAPISTSTTLVSPVQHVRHFEVNHGYFVQASFPLARKPAWGERVTGILVFNQMYRRGPLLDLLLNTTSRGTLFPSIAATQPDPLRVTRRIDKYTAAINWQISRHFFLKFDYSYWVMGRSSTRSQTSLGLVDIYQGATSIVMGF